MCTQATTDSKKYDQGKLRWDLLPLNLIEKIVEIYTFGAEKYGPNTWQNLEDGYNRYKAAMFRHLMEFEKGNVIDDESGMEHLAHMVWNGIAMLHASENEWCYESTYSKIVIPKIGQKLKFQFEHRDGVYSGIGTLVSYLLDQNGEVFLVEEEDDAVGKLSFNLKRTDIIEFL